MPLPVLIGANVEPNAHPVGRSSEQALLIGSLGLGLLTVQDHPYQAAFDDTWTLLTFLAARTRHVTLVPTVSSPPLRPPTVLAKAAATLDRLTGSRRTLKEAADARVTGAEADGWLPSHAYLGLWSGGPASRIPGSRAPSHAAGSSIHR